MAGGKRKVRRPRLAAYNLLTMDADRTDLAVVEKRDTGGFKVTSLWTGRKVGAIPPSVKLTLGPGKPPDMMGNSLSWLIVSERFVQAATPFTGDNVEFLPLAVTVPSPAGPVRYFVANPLGEVNAIKAKGDKSEVTLYELVIDPAAVPADRHLFRLKYQINIFLVSAALAEALLEKAPEGVHIEPVKVAE
jgi:hypothetical protein